MDSYVKPVLFAVVLAVIAWDVTSGIGPQGSVTINNKAGSSSAFIQQESNQNVLNTPKPTVNIQPKQSGGTRDYVNPQVFPVGQPKIQTNTGNTRDYVNPNPTSLTISKYIAPNPNPNPNPNPQNRGTIRDYVAPTRRPQYPALPNQNQNQPNNQRPNFPGLPSGPPTNSQGNTGTTPISYANKVAGGVTTTKPQFPTTTTKPNSPAGPPNPAGSTTEKPEEGPTDPELREFSEALLRRDVNNAAKFVTVNYQGKTTSQSQNDEAPQKLLEVKPEAFQIATISKLKLLHNNYILDTSENEHVTAQEKAEENELLEAMLTTPVMQYTKNFLISKGKISKDPKDFKDLLKIIWFSMYSRGAGRIGSSGFEHIFLAELKKNEVSGMHNWVYFDQAEISKIVDYLGYMKKIDLGEKGAILKFHFKLNGVDKPVDSMFIGTSPELEVALYTTCYLFRADRVCPLRLNGNNFIIRTYNFRYRGKNMIGSAFPEI